tara:strand:- start:302 stop:529 length:228 start_codon:yes stop_codon:yes gene_type:complete
MATKLPTKYELMTARDEANIKIYELTKENEKLKKSIQDLSDASEYYCCESCEKWLPSAAFPDENCEDCCIYKAED